MLWPIGRVLYALRYWAGGAWSRAGEITSADQWKSYVADAATREVMGRAGRRRAVERHERHDVGGAEARVTARVRPTEAARRDRLVARFKTRMGNKPFLVYGQEDARLAAVQGELDAVSGQLSDTYEELTLIYQISSGMRVNRSIDEFFLQAWFMTRVSLLPTILVSIPFGAVIALQVGGLIKQFGAQSFTGAASVLAVVQQAAAAAWDEGASFRERIEASPEVNSRRRKDATFKPGLYGEGTASEDTASDDTAAADLTISLVTGAQRGSPAGTRYPFIPSRTTSGVPPTLVATTGRPAAHASSWRTARCGGPSPARGRWR